MNSMEEDRFAQELIERAGRPQCPDHVVANILAAVQAEQRRRRQKPLRILALAVAAAAVLLLAILPGRFQLSHPQPTQLSQAEIDATRAEIEQAFSIISQSMSRSSRIVDDQLRENVTGRILQGVLRTPTPAVDSTPSTSNQDQSRLDSSKHQDSERNLHA